MDDEGLDDQCMGYEGLDDRCLGYAPEDARPGGWKCLRLVAVEIDDLDWLFRRAPREGASREEVLRWFELPPLRFNIWMCVHCGARLRYPIGESVPRFDAEPHIDGACLRRALSKSSLVVGYRRR